MSKLLGGTNSWCFKCGENHRPTPAVPGLVDENGEPACVEHQVLKQAAPPNEGKTNAGSRVSTISISPVRHSFARGPEVETAPPSFEEDRVSRTCNVDDCKEILAESNISGFCRIHRPHKKVGNVQNPSAVPERRPTHASDEFVAERVSAFLTSLPITDQRRLVEAWFEGRI